MGSKLHIEKYRIRTLENGIRVLNELSSAGRAMGLSTIASRVSLPKNNVFRILATLEHLGYVEQRGETRDYVLGLGTFALGQSTANFNWLIERIRPVLTDLVARWNETAYLSIIRQHKAFYIDVVEGSLPVRPCSRYGESVPLWSTAIGKAYLMTVSAKELELFAEDHEASGDNEDVQRFLGDVGNMQSRGYVVEDEEFEPEVRSVAVPILSQGRRFVASISISGPVHRFTLEKIDREIAPALLQVANRVTAILDRKGPSNKAGKWKRVRPVDLAENLSETASEY